MAGLMDGWAGGWMNGWKGKDIAGILYAWCYRMCSSEYTKATFSAQ